MTEKRDVIRRLRAGQSIRQINKETGIHRTIIRDIRNLADKNKWIGSGAKLPTEDQVRRTLERAKNKPEEKPHPLDRFYEDIKLDNDFGVYTENNVTVLTDLFLKGADRDELDPILDTCRDRFVNELESDEQRLFKQKARAFVRSYGFLSQIMTFEVAYWERLYYFLKFLLDKLPALEREDPDIDVLQHVDMESYRVEKRAAEEIQLDEAEARLKPKGEDVPSKVSEPEKEYLSQVIQEFNDRFGTKWTENDKIRNFLFEELPDNIAGDNDFVRKVQSSDRQNARITVEERVVSEFQDLIMTHTDLYKKFTDDPEFKAFVQSMIFEQVYEVEQSAGG